MRMQDLIKGKVVRIRVQEYRPDYWNDGGDMDEYMGAIVTVSKNDGDWVYIEEDGGEWSWGPEDFEEIDEEEETDPNILFKNEKKRNLWKL
jgi:hypothetical protein